MCNVCNINKSIPKRKKRANLKIAICEMIKREVLASDSGFVNDSGMVILRRSGLHFMKNFIEAEPDPEPDQVAAHGPESATIVSWIMTEIKKIDSGYSDSQGGSWLKNLSALLEGRTSEEIKETFRWALGHSYWTAHVVAPYSFRKHYTSIRSAYLKYSAKSSSSGEACPFVYFKAIRELLSEAKIESWRCGAVFEIDLCPFCKDRERKFRMNCKTGMFSCLQCGEKGDFEKFERAINDTNE